MFSEMLPIAISIGINYFDYWNMTIGEIEIILNGYKISTENKSKEMIAKNYNLATFISSFVIKQLNGEEIPPLYDLYPDIFTNEAKEKEEKLRTELLKAQLLDFAIGHNKQRSQK